MASTQGETARHADLRVSFDACQPGIGLDMFVDRQTSLRCAGRPRVGTMSENSGRMRHASGGSTVYPRLSPS